MGIGFAPFVPGGRQIIKLLRTHPGHLKGIRTHSSNSPRPSPRGFPEGPSFRKIFQNTVGKLTRSIVSTGRTTPFLKDFLTSVRPSNDIQPNQRIIPAFFQRQTNTIEGTNSVKIPPQNIGNFEPFIEVASRTFGVEKGLIRAVIKAESNFDPRAKSRSGAVGLMQLLPSTGRELGVKDLYDPRENIFGGTRYLAMLLDRYEGNLELTLAAYNWGPGNLGKAPDGIPRETKEYVQRVLKYL